MNDPDDRVRRYLRSRADLPVPRDLRWPSVAGDKPRSTTIRSPLRWGRLAASVAVAAAVVGVVVVANPPSDGAGPLPTAPPAIGSAGPSSPVNAEFPTTVSGMPVVSVVQAVELLQRGDLDGRAVAVAGYFFEEASFSCPIPMGYVSPLEDYCRFAVAFTDDEASATLCVYGESSVSCRPASGTHLAPFFMSETSGAALRYASDRTPVPLVLIGHSGDPRQWQCAAETQEACRQAFVVDRIAWANGHDVPLTAPATTSEWLAPHLTVDQATAAIGLDDEVLTAAAFRAGDISGVDPRWNMAGDNMVWIVRSIESVASNAGATRSVTVSLVDDATGERIDVRDLSLDAGYRPARLWSIATTPGQQCCVSNTLPFFRVRSNDGTTLHDGMAGDAHSHEGVTIYGLGQVPLVLDPGTYSVTVWLASIDAGVIGPPTGDECSTEVTLSEFDDLMVEAIFPAVGQDCTFGQPSAPRLNY